MFTNNQHVATFFVSKSDRLLDMIFWGIRPRRLMWFKWTLMGTDRPGGVIARHRNSSGGPSHDLP